MSLVTVSALLWFTPPIFAAEEKTADARLESLLNDIKAAIQEAEDQKTAQPKFLAELREIVRSHDASEYVELLFDDFRDGDFTTNPAWVVESGTFRVAQGVGLRSQFTLVASQPAAAPEQKQDLGSALLGAVVTELQKGATDAVESATPVTTLAEIQAPLVLSNSFTVKLQLQTGAHDNTDTHHFEFGPYQGVQRDSGYRLVYRTGQNPTLELQRLTNGRSAVVETASKVSQLGDTRVHTIEWQRNSDGTMVIRLDGKVVIETADKATQTAFDGFTVVNRGGDYTLREITILGQPQES